MPHQGAPPSRQIVLNGRACQLPAPGTPAAALEELGLEPSARGVAVAVDGEVVPRAEWDSLELSEGSRVEVLSAMQGG
jgi:sulfur carrier protein